MSVKFSMLGILCKFHLHKPSTAENNIYIYIFFNYYANLSINNFCIIIDNIARYLFELIRKKQLQCTNGVL